MCVSKNILNIVSQKHDEKDNGKCSRHQKAEDKRGKKSGRLNSMMSVSNLLSLHVVIRSLQK